MDVPNVRVADVGVQLVCHQHLAHWTKTLTPYLLDVSPSSA